MRKVLLPVLLIASHGIALWLGSQRVGNGSAGAAAPSAALPVSAGIAELQRRSAQRQAAYANEPPFRAGVEAARLNISPTADVAALVKAGAGDYREGDVPDEVLAAYGIWMDRDPLAALRWLMEWDREGVTWSFGIEIIEHLKRAGPTKLGEYMRAAPGCRKQVLNMALWDLLDESAPATRTDIVLGMPRLEDRLEWLTTQSASAESYQGQIARIRETLGHHGSAMFLWHLSETFLTDSQLAEIRSAGFSAAALADCEERQEKNRRWREEMKHFAAGDEPSRHEPLQLVASPIQSSNIIWERFPEFKDWCRDAAEGRLTPDEIVSRVEPHLAPSTGLQERVRDIVRIQIFHSNPRLALEWIQASGGDVRGKIIEALQHSGDSVAGEVRAEIAAQVFTDDLPADVAEGLVGFYRDWQRSDAAACIAAINRLPEGPLKARLQAIAEEVPE